MIRRAPRLVAVTVTIVLLALGALAGCRADVGTVIKVGSQGAGTLGVRLAIDPAVQQLLEREQAGGVDVLFKEFLGTVPAGWTAQQGKGPDGMRWVSATRPFADLSQLARLVAAGPASVAPGGTVTTQVAGPGTGAVGAAGAPTPDGPATNGGGLAALGLTGVDVRQQTGLVWITTTFYGHVEGKAMADRIAGEGLTDLDPAALDGVVHIEERVSLPGYARESNAQTREDGALVWRFGPGESGDLRAESIAPRWVVAGPVLGVLVLLLVLGVVVLVRWRAARRRARRARERRRQIRFE